MSMDKDNHSDELRGAALHALIERGQSPLDTRLAQQAAGAHPAPCARHCEATAFYSELRRLQSENEQLRAGYDAARLEIASLQAQLEAVGAGGVGALPNPACLHQIKEPAAQALDAWQPIETAPKDGESVILTEGGKVFHGGFITIDFKEIRDSDGNFIDQIDPDEFWMNFDDGDSCNPTHWMPDRSLPMPPDAAIAAQQGEKT